jgi:hypothetical protein
MQYFSISASDWLKFFAKFMVYQYIFRVLLLIKRAKEKSGFDYFLCLCE